MDVVPFSPPTHALVDQGFRNDLHTFGPFLLFFACVGIARLMKSSSRVPNWLIPPVLSVTGIGCGVAAAVVTGGNWREWLATTLLGLMTGAGTVGIHQSAKSIGSDRAVPPSDSETPPKGDRGATGGMMRMRLALWCLALVLTFGVVGCTPQEAKTAKEIVDVAAVACVPLVVGLAPGFQWLCGLSDTDIDGLIDALTKDPVHGQPDPNSPRMKLLRAAMAVREQRAKSPPK